MFQRANPVKDHDFYVSWALEHDRCQACGITSSEAARVRWPGLSTHHIAKPGRSDERCNLLRMCQRDHDLAEGRRVLQEGIVLPKLTIGICLSIKKSREPEDFDLERICQLMHWASIDLEPIPEFLIEEWRKRTGQ